jgi:glutathione peroxidase
LTEKNYQQLQQLHASLGARGFSVLAFPCNQFGHQEPWPNAQIAEFAAAHGATFPLFDKILVNGAETHPLYRWLKELAPGPLGTRGIAWNFTKFLLDRGGRPVTRYLPITAPLDIAPDVEPLLQAAATP